jgi:hypothetical protein
MFIIKEVDTGVTIVVNKYSQHDTTRYLHFDKVIKILSLGNYDDTPKGLKTTITNCHPCNECKFTGCLFNDADVKIIEIKDTNLSNILFGVKSGKRKNSKSYRKKNTRT